MSADLQAWLDARPDIKSLRLAVADLNGIARGKRIPARHASKAFDGGMRMPFSTLNVDVWGADIDGSPLVFSSGDADGALRPTARGLVPMTWLGAPSALLPLVMFNEDGTPFAGDPRHALSQVLARYADHGLTPVVATEMEFYLLDGQTDLSNAGPRPPRSPLTGQRLDTPEILSLGEIDAFDAFFTDLYAACEAMGIPADAAISESGPGQFEINLLHGNDALKAADDAWLFKIAARGVARKHGFAASFMAKPYGDQAGNGLHTHFSILDARGRNIFNDGSAKGSDTLHHAVAGLLAAMRPSTLIFAPHFNSFRRIAPNSHAPTKVCWGYENRTTAIRIPGGAPTARRIEHRVAGGDVNPYLMLATVLGAALNGIEDAEQPADPVTGNGAVSAAPDLLMTWDAAIEAAQSSSILARILPPPLIQNLIATKRQEQARFNGANDNLETKTYAETV